MPHGKKDTIGTLTATPNPVSVGQAFEVQGSGWVPGQQLYVGLAGHADLLALIADAQGKFTKPYPGGIVIPFTYTFIVLRAVTFDIVASATLTVQ